MANWRAWLGVELNVVSLKEKLISVVGGFLSILLLSILSRKLLPFGGGMPLVGSMGASAVLLFGVPHGPLSQPWPVIAGHGISALIGVLCAKFIPATDVAAALAVGLAIGAMHQFKCIHPPGGATALTAVIGGPAIRAMGFQFVTGPVFLNALAIVGFAVLFNSLFHWRRYPAFRNARAASSTTPNHEEIIRALRSMDSFIDITEEDLARLTELLGKRKPVPALSASVPTASEAQVRG